MTAEIINFSDLKKRRYLQNCIGAQFLLFTNYMQKIFSSINRLHELDDFFKHTSKNTYLLGVRQYFASYKARGVEALENHDLSFDLKNLEFLEKELNDELDSCCQEIYEISGIIEERLQRKLEAEYQLLISQAVDLKIPCDQTPNDSQPDLLLKKIQELKFKILKIA